ncbi:MAG: hypothetical protein AABO58_15485 [Acidobacteriota bacterium]
MTALAVDANGNTSEFSPCATIQGNGVFQLPNSFVHSEGGGSLALTVSRSAPRL